LDPTQTYGLDPNLGPYGHWTNPVTMGLIIITTAYKMQWPVKGEEGSKKDKWVAYLAGKLTSNVPNITGKPNEWLVMAMMVEARRLKWPK